MSPTREDVEAMVERGRDLARQIIATEKDRINVRQFCRQVADLLEALSPQGEAKPVAWRCPECKWCTEYARIDQPSPKGGYEPGDTIRCVNCKHVGYWPRNLASPPDARREVLEEAAKKATSFLVGNPAKGIPLRSPTPHEIADAIRALADAPVSAPRKNAEPVASASDDVLDAMEGEEREMERRAYSANPTGAK